jgi:hypothetical protein
MNEAAKLLDATIAPASARFEFGQMCTIAITINTL